MPELTRIISLLLGSARLITLIGPGGIGKTRLASETIRRYQKAKNEPVFWVRLARMPRDASRSAIEEEVAQSVLEGDFSARPTFDALVARLTTTTGTGSAPEPVLVLDNCEHVVVGAGELIADLLVSVPTLTILATSRAAIGWVDEYVVVVPPLTRTESIALFRQRADLAGQDITDELQISMVTSICHHLHHHPLYVRLAAARLLRQPLSMILHELSGTADDRRMQWSSGPRVGTDPRHQAVGDVIAWSYNLCDEQERLLLERMSVFVAGYDVNPEERRDDISEIGVDLSAIRSICTDDRALGSDDLEQTLERLVDQSLVIAHIGANEVRYSLLESIRLFMQRKLRERSIDGVDETMLLAERHLHYYHQRVLEARATWFSPAERALLDWARAEWDNILTAIEFSLTAHGHAATGLEICSGLIALRAPFHKGSIRITRQWTERSLAATRTAPVCPADLEIDALAQLVMLTLCQGQHRAAVRFLEDCIAVCLPSNYSGIPWNDTAETDIGLPAPAEFAWGSVLMLIHRDPLAIVVLQRARKKYDESGDAGGSATSELFAAVAAALVGTAEQAFEIAQGIRDRSTASGALWTKSWSDMVWALAQTMHGHPETALEFVRNALAYQVPSGDQWGALWAVEFRIWSLAHMISDMQRDPRSDGDRIRALATEAAQLMGGTRTLRARLGIGIGLRLDVDKMGLFGDETREAIESVQHVLGQEQFRTAVAWGTQLRPDRAEVQRLVLGTLPATKSPSSHLNDDKTPWATLSAAERAVAMLAAAGWTNGSIAARRGNSIKTVEAQVAAVLRKLEITARGDIIRHIPNENLEQVQFEETRRPGRQRRHS
ncbi:helix-turn-helix transcriptional regulator [Nocardia colli]|uniref:helix-turn-helix transcriptional regulator n=1 Tax=Nocardia colli TaxID=2545717 RepID=UPI0035D53D99